MQQITGHFGDQSLQAITCTGCYSQLKTNERKNKNAKQTGPKG